MCYAEPLIEIKQPQSESFYIQTQDLGDSVPNPPQGEAMPPLAPQLETALRAVSGKSFEGGLEGTFSKVPPKKGYKITLRNCGVINPDKIDDYIAVGGYEALAKAVTELGREGVIDEIKKSGLRGRGGAGFPTGLKWEFGAKATGEKKYIICNADEGDPGAFMDRSVLEGDPHSVLEAMAIAGFAVGADEGVIYIRAEYPLAVKRLREAIAQAEEIGLLGQNIFETGFAFKIRISLGAGAFVCGEETALLNSLEGKRGEPRLRPPFPAQKGLWQCPTVNNNVETFANVPEIILRGADWFRGIGTEKSPGTKVFALAGKVNNVGLIEVPMGTTLREIVYDFGGGLPGGKKLKAVQTGGPSGGCISNLDLGVDYESLAAVGSMMGSGGMIVTDEDDCMVNLAKFYLDFTMEESCGKCSPCRIGNTRLYEILEKITSGNGEESDLTQLEELAHTIKNTSLCGLGNSAPNPVLSTLKFFRDEYIAHVNKKCPAKACRDLIRYTITEKCIGCGICAKACPVSCISGKPKERHVIEQEKCIKCGECLAVCPPKVGAVAAE
ncbi:MAG: NADH-quinone oxidoreductase subunit NuoF [Defluviitaleaceae bacterium]|nr:NADH-quinone oxidoreductase subunit NuoF [Defluviitaleaceae bacterium]